MDGEWHLKSRASTLGHDPHIRLGSLTIQDRCFFPHTRSRDTILRAHEYHSLWPWSRHSFSDLAQVKQARMSPAIRTTTAKRNTVSVRAWPAKRMRGVRRFRRRVRRRRSGFQMGAKCCGQEALDTRRHPHPAARKGGYVEQGGSKDGYVDFQRQPVHRQKRGAELLLLPYLPRRSMRPSNTVLPSEEMPTCVPRDIRIRAKLEHTMCEVPLPIKSPYMAALHQQLPTTHLPTNPQPPISHNSTHNSSINTNTNTNTTATHPHPERIIIATATYQARVHTRRGNDKTWSEEKARRPGQPQPKNNNELEKARQSSIL